MNLQSVVLKNIIRSFLILLVITIIYFLQNFFTIEPNKNSFNENLVGNTVMVVILYIFLTTLFFNKKVKEILKGGVTSIEVFKVFLISMIVITILLSVYISILGYLGLGKTETGIYTNITSTKNILKFFVTSFVGIIGIISTTSLTVIILQSNFGILNIMKYVLLIILGFILFNIVTIFQMIILQIPKATIDMKFLLIGIIISIVEIGIYKLLLKNI